MAVSDINLLPQTAGIQLQSSPYAPPAPLDFSQLSNLQQIENQQRRMEMEGRRLEMQERQMEQAMVDRQAALERQNMLDRLTYIDKITNLPIPPKRAQRAAELQQSLGIEELFDPNRTDISVMDAARTSFEYVSHPEVRRWTQEQSALDHMAKLMEKHPNRSIYLKRESEWQNDDTGTVPFPTIADLDYIDYEKDFNKLFSEFRKGARSERDLEDFIEAYYSRPEIARQVEWDLGPGGLDRIIDSKKSLWRGFDVELGRAVGHKTSPGSANISNLPGTGILTPEQRKNIGDRMGIGGEKFTEAYIDALNSQRNPDSEESVQAYNSVAATLLTNISGGKDGLLDRTEIFVGGDRSNPIEINASEEVGSVGKGRTAKLSWLGGQAMNRLDLDGSNLNEIFEEYKLERGTSAGDKNNVYLTGRVSPELLDSIIDGISWGGNRSTRNTRDSFRKEAEGGLIINIPLGSGDRLRTSTTQESPQTIGTNTTNISSSGGSYSAIPGLAPWYSAVIDGLESSPELIDLGGGRTTVRRYNQLYDNGAPLDKYLDNLGEKSLTGLRNNNPGLDKYLSLVDSGVEDALENMTVSEVQDLQKVQIAATKGDDRIQGKRGTGAIGGIQVTQGTLNSLLDQIEDPNSDYYIEGFDRNRQRFTGEFQDLLFNMLLERRGVIDFMNNPDTLDEFAESLGQEWEAVGKLKKDNRKWNQFKESLIELRNNLLTSNTPTQEITQTPPEQPTQDSTTDFEYFGFNFGQTTPAPVPSRGQIIH